MTTPVRAARDGDASRRRTRRADLRAGVVTSRMSKDLDRTGSPQRRGHHASFSPVGASAASSAPERAPCESAPASRRVGDAHERRLDEFAARGLALGELTRERRDRAEAASAIGFCLGA